MAPSPLPSQHAGAASGRRGHLPDPAPDRALDRPALRHASILSRRCSSSGILKLSRTPSSARFAAESSSEEMPLPS